VALGIPVIELLDIRGLPAYDHPLAARDHRGRPTFSPYRQDGLVIPSDDEADLRATMARVLADPSAVVKDLQSAYSRCFCSPRSTIASMVRALDEQDDDDRLR
jgi:hypothetical protein